MSLKFLSALILLFLSMGLGCHSEPSSQGLSEREGFAQAQKGNLLPVVLMAPAGSGFTFPEEVVAPQKRLAQLLERRGVAEALLAKAYGDLGKAFFAYRFWPETEPCLMNAASLAPHSFQWPYLLGHLYLDMARPEQALEQFEKSWKLNPRFTFSQFHLGRIYLERNQLAEAEQAFAQVLEQEPASIRAQYGLALVAMARGAYEQAIAICLPIDEKMPNLKVIRQMLGIAYREMDDWDKAEPYLKKPGERAIRSNDPVLKDLQRFSLKQSKLSRGRDLLEMGRNAEAAARFQAVLADHPDHIHARLGLARSLFAEKKYALAAMEFEKVLAQDPKAHRALYYLGTKALLEGKLEKAVELLRKSIELNPAQKDAQFNLGKALGRSGEFQAAVACMNQAAIQDPGNVDAVYWQAYYLLKAEGFMAAKATLELGVQTFPSAITLRFLAARLAATCPAAAMRDGERAETLAASVTEPKYQLQKEIILSMAAAERGEFNQAASLINKALTLPQARASQPLRVAMMGLFKNYRASRPCRDLFWFENIPRH